MWKKCTKNYSFLLAYISTNQLSIENKHPSLEFDTDTPLKWHNRYMFYAKSIFGSFAMMFNPFVRWLLQGFVTGEKDVLHSFGGCVAGPWIITMFRKCHPNTLVPKLRQTIKCWFLKGMWPLRCPWNLANGLKKITIQLHVASRGHEGPRLHFFQ